MRSSILLAARAVLVLGVASLAVVVGGGIMLLSRPDFGTRPKQTYSQSPQYREDTRSFFNRQPDLLKDMRKRAFTFGVLKDWFSEGIDRSPKAPLPEVRPDIADFLKPSKTLKFIWFGHSTVLLNIGGKVLLIDPIFSGSAAPFSFMVKRFQPPVLTLSELPPIDFILISHDHYDHLDMASVKHFIPTSTKFLVPLGVSSHLVGWGLKASNIVELDWWQSAKFDDIEFVATPAQHFSGRDGIHENETLWASWVVRNEGHRVYFSGDSGYDTHFKDIGEKYGPFDVAFVENGQYNEKWREVHVLPEESVQAAIDLKAKRYVPIHWGMFILSFHTWYEPITRVAKILTSGEFTKMNQLKMVSPKLGQVVQVDDSYVNSNWWEGLF